MRLFVRRDRFGRYFSCIVFVPRDRYNTDSRVRIQKVLLKAFRGETIEYDETRHEPVGDFPADGESVTVIRPGYLWHAPGEAVLISKALVTRA